MHFFSKREEFEVSEPWKNTSLKLVKSLLKIASLEESSVPNLFIFVSKLLGYDSFKTFASPYPGKKGSMLFFALQ